MRLNNVARAWRHRIGPGRLRHLPLLFLAGFGTGCYPPPAPKFGVPVLVARSSNVNLVAVLYRNGGGALASDTYTVTVRDPGRESILATIAIHTEKPERDIKIGWSGAREVFVAAPKGEWLMQNPVVSISEGKVFARFMGRANVEEGGQK